jgi:CRP-like cAMP-binding protein
VDAPTKSGNLRNRPLAWLEASGYAEIASHLTRVELPRGLRLLDVDELIGQVYFPEDGLVSFVVVTRSGQSVEAAAIGRKGIVGAIPLLGTGLSMTESVVQIPGTAYRMPGAKLQALIGENPEIRRMIDLVTEAMMGEALQSVACIAFHTVEERLARWLLTARDQIGSDEISLTQEFLAQMLGCQRTTVTLTVRRLQAAGAIQYSRGRIHIRDAAVLAELSCECYEQASERFDRIFPPSQTA